MGFSWWSSGNVFWLTWVKKGQLGLKSLNNSFSWSRSLCQRDGFGSAYINNSSDRYEGSRIQKRGNKENLGVITSSSVTADSRGRYQLTDWSCATQKGLMCTASSETVLWCLGYWLSYNSTWSDTLERWYQYDKPLDIFWKGNLCLTLTL